MRTLAGASGFRWIDAYALDCGRDAERQGGGAEEGKEYGGCFHGDRRSEVGGRRWGSTILWGAPPSWRLHSASCRMHAYEKSMDSPIPAPPNDHCWSERLSLGRYLGFALRQDAASCRRDAGSPRRAGYSMHSWIGGNNGIPGLSRSFPDSTNRCTRARPPWPKWPC